MRHVVRILVAVLILGGCAGADVGNPGASATYDAALARQAILARSAAGKTMMTSAQNLSKQADTEFKGQADALQKELATVQQQLAILAPDVRAQKQKEFTTKQEAFQQRVGFV